MRPINLTETRLTLAALVAVFAFAAWDARADGPQPGTSDPQVCPPHIVPNPCLEVPEPEREDEWEPAPEPEPEPEEPTDPGQEEPDHDEEPDGEPDHDEPEHDEEPDREDGGY